MSDPLGTNDQQESDAADETEKKLFSTECEEYFVTSGSVQVIPEPSERTNITDEFNSTTFNSRERKRSFESHQESTDPDKSFLLSLLPDYKKLTYEQKIDFRIYALQFFKNIVEDRNIVSN